MNSAALTETTDSFQSSLLDWYDAHARDLPWRQAPSLYKTVVSEFMLQQTQVKTVLPYFAAWLSKYPDFASLAQASEADVLKSWEGLGYYSRARNLQKLAREIAALETPPKDAASWLAFPGVGPYAAAAICSIAFSDPSAVVDGNVVRILSRLTADPAEYKSGSAAATRYRPLAETLLNRERPGDHNQAMMELGATLCHKQTPQCLLCPVKELCQARQNGNETAFPRLQKTAIEKQAVNRAWVVGPKGVLLHKIPDTAKRMKGLHEIPSLQQLELPIPKSLPLIERKRSITKYRITERFFSVAAEQLNASLPPDCLWATPDSLDALPFSGPHRKWIGELLRLDRRTPLQESFAPQESQAPQNTTVEKR